MALTQVAPQLYLNPGHTGNIDINFARNARMSIVHASKSWYDMNIGESLLKRRDDPEYLTAWRGNELYMNMVDTPDPSFFSHALIDPAIAFMIVNYMKAKCILLHCDMGEHRSATLMMLFMAIMGLLSSNLDDAVAHFKVIYPYFNTTHERGGETGIFAWVAAHWKEYV